MTLAEQELVRILGYDATLKLEKIFRSQFIYIGRESHSIKVIRARISHAAADALVAYMQGDTLWVPSTIYRQERNEKIFQETQETKPLSIEQMAAKYKLKARAIRMILQRKTERLNEQKKLRA
ncbi:hypothetical protein tloyanaT_13370 [Thalassotalea loyana]|uniref:Mor transcription activator domain-containing protein n=1 Tax=Thalassotalea loyana TaxID=280483 RepID=A0ABQ6HCB4_9GAMM|nr:Mor transcription activator family protein [Thalassotalea loyana]GLX85085.1 hypothetical protein tloyanaT_13370 [Thalassotalea loyana]